jgi:hypothetical protein
MIYFPQSYAEMRRMIADVGLYIDLNFFPQISQNSQI